MATPKSPPRSVAHWADPFLNLAVGAGTYAGLCNSDLSNIELALIIGAAVTALVCGLELLRAPWRHEPRPKASFKQVIQSAFTKWVGNMAGLAVVLFALFVLAEYRHANYRPLFEVMPDLLPWVPLVTAACIFFTEWRLGPTVDPCRKLGRFVLSRGHDFDWPAIRHELLSWAIKGIFLTINFCVLVFSIASIRGKIEHLADFSWPAMQMTIMSAIYTAIIASILPGYLFSSRLFGTSVKKIDYSWFGWTITMFCYAPLTMGVSRWVTYKIKVHKMVPWIGVSDGVSYLLYGLGVAIILTELFHYWGESIFGIRASNLSNRGIITNGPYRFFKHPVYFMKCIGWGLMWLPFVAGSSPWEDFRLTLLFGGICWIYFMRAWVEERLLSDDPVYIEYALWMDKHGVLAWMGRLMPFLTFRWRVARWDKQRALGPDAYIN